jgi:1-acyl-sn-glycerol-3-phosphate acyltransferase
MPDWLRNLWYDCHYCNTMAIATLAFSCRFEGGRNVPRKGPALLIANHQSFIDPVLIGLAAGRRLHYLARKTLFKNPIFGAFLRSVNCVPVDQVGVAKEGLKTTIEQLKEGHAVLVYPEGERTWTGQIQPLKPGVVLLIKRARAPIIPVGVAGAFDAYPRTAKLPTFSPLFMPATKGAVAVSVGKPIPAERFLDMPREQVLDELHHELTIVHERAEHLRRKS